MLIAFYRMIISARFISAISNDDRARAIRSLHFLLILPRIHTTSGGYRTEEKKKKKESRKEMD